ncbi:hypothetical protein ACJJTC_008512 [Scirpophaga incertulas]
MNLSKASVGRSSAPCAVHAGRARADHALGATRSMRPHEGCIPPVHPAALADSLFTHLPCALRDFTYDTGVATALMELAISISSSTRHIANQIRDLLIAGIVGIRFVGP